MIALILTLMTTLILALVVALILTPMVALIVTEVFQYTKDPKDRNSIFSHVVMGVISATTFPYHFLLEFCSTTV